MKCTIKGTMGLATMMTGLALVAGGCAGGAAEHAVSGRGEMIDRTTHPLLGVNFESINGDYGAGCTNRSGSWSLEVASGATLDNAALSVVQGNTACTLTLTSIRTHVGMSSVLHEASAPFALGTSYQGSAVSFAPTMGVPAFFANAKLSSTSFGGNFVLHVVYSDDVNNASESNTADFAVAEGSATASSVPAPAYSVALDSIALQTDEDDVVTSATGNAALSLGAMAQAGQTYLVVSGSPTSYDDIHTAYLAGTAVAMPDPSEIPMSAFDLSGADLTDDQVRTLIIANTDTATGVRSYQTFTITFHPATRTP
jgi:hypothetical protein